MLLTLISITSCTHCITAAGSCCIIFVCDRCKINFPISVFGISSSSSSSSLAKEKSQLSQTTIMSLSSSSLFVLNGISTKEGYQMNGRGIIIVLLLVFVGSILSMVFVDRGQQGREAGGYQDGGGGVPELNN